MTQKTFTLLLFLALAGSVFSQKSLIHLSTKMDSAAFRVYLNEEEQNNMRINEFDLENLSEGKYLIRLSFGIEGIADVKKKIKLNKNQTRKFEVIKRSKIEQKIGQLGRFFHRITHKNEHKGDVNLKDVYLLKEIY